MLQFARDRLVTALITALLATFTGCGGDSTGVDGDGDDVPLPERVQMNMSGDLSWPVTAADTVRFHLELGGRWDVANDSIDVEGGIRVGSSTHSFAAFLLGIASPLAWPEGSPPVTGSWIVDASPRHLEATVITDAGGTGEAGVRLLYADGVLGSTTLELPWSTFLAPPAGSLAWVQWAAFGYACLDLAHAHMMLVADGLALAIANDDALVRAGAAGLHLPGAPSPLGGTAGSMEIHLQDNGSGDLGPGDALEFTHTSWWIQGPGSAVGRLLDGSWSLTNYIENADPFAVGGQVLFNDIKWRRATHDGATWQVSDRAPMFGTATLFVQRPT